MGAKDPSFLLYVLCVVLLWTKSLLFLQLLNPVPCALGRLCLSREVWTRWPLQPDLSCDPVKSHAIARAKPWPSMLGGQSKTEGPSDLPVPCTELPTAFQGRAPASNTHTDTAHQPQFLQLHLIAIYLPVLHLKLQWSVIDCFQEKKILESVLATVQH